MVRIGVGVGARFRWGVLSGLIAVILLTSITFDDAEARRRRSPANDTSSSRYAAIVVDANTGEVLHAENADAIRHPASLTKMMTLYLLFEQLEAGRLKLDSELEVSPYASAQAPSKLGLRPGSTIDVEDAIKALVTKSANDVAVVIAEALGGDEDDFARLMTRKARALGMTKTIYKNASGLPDKDQITTARDQAMLGRALQDRFPRYYPYFATRNFYFRGRSIGNHNRLLGSVAGIDGIKTGYVNASGFNLVSSMRRDGRHLVATVMGGSSARSRDERMRSLLEANIREASLKRTAPKLVEVAQAGESGRTAPLTRSMVRQDTAPAQAPAMQAAAVDPRLPVVEQRVEQGSHDPAVDIVRTPSAAPAPGSSEPIQPIPVRTMTVKRAGIQTASAGSVPLPVPASREAPVVGPRPGVLGTLSSREVAAAGQGFALASAPQPSARPALPRDGWVIQIGAFPEEARAKDQLKSAQTLARTVLGSAEPFTEPVAKGDTTLYRARFAGFDREKAEAACKYLKRNEITCLALKN